jgi:hypothetical protein
MDIQGSAFIEGNAGVTYVTRFSVCGLIYTIDRFRQDPGTGCFTHSTRTAKQKRMCKLLVFDRIFQCGCDMALAHYGIKSLGPVLTRRNNKLLHYGENKQAILYSDWLGDFSLKFKV